MQLSLAQNYGVGTMLAVALAAVVLTALFYRRAFGSLGVRRWGLLLALRVVAILLIVGLLFQPVLSYQTESGRKPAVVFLLDASASMSLSDDASGRSRFDRAREKMERWQEKLQNDFRLLPIAFAEQPQRLDGPESLRELAPTGKATSLVEALRFAAAQLPPAEVAAVLLLSDGIHNAAGHPSQTARQLGVVVHSVGVGASVRNSLAYRDIQVVGLDCPDRMMLGNMARVTASIDAVGLGGRTAKVVLEQDGRPVASQELTLDDAEGSQTVALEFRPTEKGRHTYTVRVEPAAEEKIIENNRRSAVATVVEKGIRVLYLEGTLRTEYGALVDRFLAKDPDVEFCALVQTKPNVFLRRTNMTGLQLDAIPSDPSTIDRFDVFLIGDLDSSYFRPRQQEMFVERVRRGAGLLMLGGYHSHRPGGYDR
ncbi:MAG: VWA domain-containing protein, partial [Thermoguttaceae bacterium]